MYKVMLVEDEVTLRNGMARLINWDELGLELVSICANGLEALEEFKHKAIDIVIADIRMPRMNGLELFAYLQEHYPETKKVILSAYAEFQYAQEALSYGVNGYIVKSALISDLPPLLRKLKNDMDHQIHEKVQKPASCAGSNSLDLISQCLTLPPASSCRIAILHYSPTTSTVQSVLTQYIKGAVGSDMLYYAWIDAAHLLCVYISESRSNTSAQALTSKLSELCRSSSRQFKISVRVGISRVFHGNSGLSNAYHEATEAETHALEMAPICCHDQLEDKKTSWITQNESTLEYLIQLAQQDDSVIRECLTESFCRQIQYIRNYRDVHACINQLLLQISQLFAHTAAAKEASTLQEAAWGELSNAETMQLCLDICIQSMLTFSSYFKRLRMKSVVLEVNNYVHQHYAEKIRLSDVAKKLHVNNSYLSRVYKATTGESIVSYINRYRVNRAKHLLLTTNQSVADIAVSVGIDDPSYFSTVFIKYAGVVPTQFRNTPPPASPKFPSSKAPKEGQTGS